MKRTGELSEHADWLADLTNGDAVGDELRSLLATRFAKPDLLDRAVHEVEIARRVRLFLTTLRDQEIEISADFEARLMARVSQDAALLSLLEVYLTGFSRTVIELINALFSILPAPVQPEFSTA